MEIKENSFGYKLRKKLIPLIVTAFVLYLLWHAFGSSIPGLLPLLKKGDEKAIAAYLSEQSGVQGVVCVILLSIIQVVSIVMPGMAIQVAAGVIYGWWKAFLMCYTGFVGANVGVFLFAKRVKTNTLEKVSMGRRSVWLMEKLKSTKPQFMVTIASMIPAIPNGIIPYIAAQSPIEVKEFTIAIMTGCWIQILSSCIAGSFIIRGEWLFTILALIAQVGVIGIVLWKREWFLSKMP